MRDYSLEKRLQEALDNGRNVWIIGDVHGFSQTLEELLESLKLEPDDFVVLLGDLIDRGPNSARVVEIVKNECNIFSLKGNHESMMVEAIDSEELISYLPDAQSWYRNGGIATLSSYISSIGRTKVLDRVNSDVEWMDNLPSEIVLDSWRLVHAGYDPRKDLDNQDEEIHLWIRNPFYRTDNVIDKDRSVVFGHTVTAYLPNHNMQDLGKTWHSSIQLGDGRSSMIGLDTCLYHLDDAPAVLSALNLQTQEIVQQKRVEKWTREINKALNMDSEVHGFYPD